MEAFAFVCMMVALATAFTLDPVAPLLMFGLCVRLGAMGVPALLAPPFAPFGSLAFISGMGAVYLAHAALDKIPPLAHLADFAGILLKPLGVALLGAALLRRVSGDMPIHWTVSGAILAALVLGAATLQVARAKVRLAASAGTLGVAHPFISLVDNILALALSFLAFTHPVAAAVLVMLVVIAPLFLLVMAIGAALGGAGALSRRMRGAR